MYLRYCNLKIKMEFMCHHNWRETNRYSEYIGGSSFGRVYDLIIDYICTKCRQTTYRRINGAG